MKLSLSPLPSLTSLPLALVLARTASADPAAQVADEDGGLTGRCPENATEPLPSWSHPDANWIKSLAERNYRSLR